MEVKFDIIVTNTESRAGKVEENVTARARDANLIQEWHTLVTINDWFFRPVLLQNGYDHFEESFMLSAFKKIS